MALTVTTLFSSKFNRYVQFCQYLSFYLSFKSQKDCSSFLVKRLFQWPANESFDQTIFGQSFDQIIFGRKIVSMAFYIAANEHI